MEWFGPAPFSNACEEVPRVETPTAPCAWCGESFTADDDGYTIPHCGETISNLPYHLECWLRQLFGSVGHIQGECSCFEGTAEDPPGMTRREAAKAAAEMFRRLKMPMWRRW